MPGQIMVHLAHLATATRGTVKLAIGKLQRLFV